MVPHDAFAWIWKGKNTPKIKFFCWLLLSDRLNTRNMLRRRHYNVGNTAECTMCNAREEETVEHLFFHCDYSKRCWRTLQFPVSDDLMANRLDLITHSRSNWTRPMFIEVFAIGAWSICKERNGFYFNNVPPSITGWTHRFKEDFQLLVHRTKECKQTFINSLVRSR